jgi:hypothetical protein
MGASPSVLIERFSAMSYGRGTEQRKSIGKFVKEPFDEEARKNMFGQRAKETAGRK